MHKTYYIFINLITVFIFDHESSTTPVKYAVALADFGVVGHGHPRLESGALERRLTPLHHPHHNGRRPSRPPLHHLRDQPGPCPQRPHDHTTPRPISSDHHTYRVRTPLLAASPLVTPNREYDALGGVRGLGQVGHEPVGHGRIVHDHTGGRTRADCTRTRSAPGGGREGREVGRGGWEGTREGLNGGGHGGERGWYRRGWGVRVGGGGAPWVGRECARDRFEEA